MGSLTRKAESTEKLLLEREKSFLARGPPPLAGEGLGMGSLTRKSRKSQKSYASVSLPLGEDGRGLFPLGEDLGEALRGRGGGSVTSGSSGFEIRSYGV